MPWSELCASFSCCCSLLVALLFASLFVYFSRCSRRDRERELNLGLAARLAIFPLSCTLCEMPPPIPLTQNLVWNECGSACTPTCAEPAPMCTMQCVARCECQVTTVDIMINIFCVIFAALIFCVACAILRDMYFLFALNYPRTERLRERGGGPLHATGQVRHQARPAGVETEAQPGVHTDN